MFSIVHLVNKAGSPRCQAGCGKGPEVPPVCQSVPHIPQPKFTYLGTSVLTGPSPTLPHWNNGRQLGKLEKSVMASSPRDFCIYNPQDAAMRKLAGFGTS